MRIILSVLSSHPCSQYPVLVLWMSNPILVAWAVASQRLTPMTTGVCVCLLVLLFASTSNNGFKLPFAIETVERAFHLSYSVLMGLGFLLWIGHQIFSALQLPVGDSICIFRAMVKFGETAVTFLSDNVLKGLESFSTD